MQSILRILLFSDGEKQLENQSYQGLKVSRDKQEKVNALTRKRDILKQGILKVFNFLKSLFFGGVSGW